MLYIKPLVVLVFPDSFSIEINKNTSKLNPRLDQMT